MTTITLRRGRARWMATIAGETIPLSVAADCGAVDAISAVRANYPDAKIGVHAPDIGPAVTAACERAGHGQTLWVR